MTAVTGIALGSPNIYIILEVVDELFRTDDLRNHISRVNADVISAIGKQ